MQHKRTGLIVFAMMFLYGMLFNLVGDVSLGRLVAATAVNGIFTVDAGGSGDFTTIQACADAVSPGETCLVKAGTYNEIVNVTKSGTGNTNRIVFKSNERAVVEGFQLNGAYVTVEGFKLTGANQRYQGYIDAKEANVYRKTPGGSNCLIKNNIIGPGQTDVAGINIRDGVSGCLVQNNTFTDLNYTGFNISGSQNTFEYNIMEKMNGWDMIRLFGDSNVIRRNIFRNSEKITGAHGNHPDFIQFFGDIGGTSKNHIIEENWVENLTAYQVGQMNSGLMNAKGFADIKNVTFRKNVFVNITHNWNSTVPDAKFENNTFYKVANTLSGIAIGGSLTRGVSNGTTIQNNVFLEGGEYPDPYGYRGYYNISGVLLTNEVVRTLAGVDGDSALARDILNDLAGRGYLVNANGEVTAEGKAITNISSFEINSAYDSYKTELFDLFKRTAELDTTAQSTIYHDYNYVAGHAIDGYPSKKNFEGLEAHSINGGNPNMANPNNPIGPDGLPFTADDGLRPKSNSPLCGAGRNGATIGAYSCTGTDVINATYGAGGSGSTNTGNTNTGTTGSTNTGSTNTGSTGSTNTGSTNTTNTTNTGSASSLILNLDFDDYNATYNSTTGLVPDKSGKGNNADCQRTFERNGQTFNQCPSKITSPKKGSAVQFSGGALCEMGSDYFAIQKSASLNNLAKGTIALWAKNETVKDAYTTFIDAYSPQIPNSWNFGRSTSENTNFGFRVSNGASYSGATIFEFPEKNGTWDHYAITWDGSSVKGYLNGELLVTKTQAFSELVLADYIAIGGNAHYAKRNANTENCETYYGWPEGDYVFPNHGFFAGGMDEIRMYNRALSASEVLSLFNGVDVGNTTNTSTGTTGNTNTGSTNTTNATNSTNNTSNTTNTTNTTSNTNTSVNTTPLPTVVVYDTKEGISGYTDELVPVAMSLEVVSGEYITIPFSQNTKAAEILISRSPSYGVIDAFRRFPASAEVHYIAPEGFAGVDYITYYIVDAEGNRSRARNAIAITVSKKRTVRIPTATTPEYVVAPQSRPVSTYVPPETTYVPSTTKTETRAPVAQKPNTVQITSGVTSVERYTPPTRENPRSEFTLDSVLAPATTSEAIGNGETTLIKEIRTVTFSYLGNLFSTLRQLLEGSIESMKIGK